MAWIDVVWGVAYFLLVIVAYRVGYVNGYRDGTARGRWEALQEWYDAAVGQLVRREGDYRG